MKLFIYDLIERAVKTAAQTAIATIGTSSVFGDVNWGVVASTAGLAAVISILTSIASRSIGDKDNASIIKDTEGE